MITLKLSPVEFFPGRPESFDAIFESPDSRFESVDELLIGSRVRLRRLVADDLEFIYRWENAPEVWRYGDCGAEPDIGGEFDNERFSRAALRQFIDNQSFGFWANEQQRLVICALANPAAGVDSGLAGGSDFCAVDDPYPEADAFPDTPIGFIDLFNFDPKERSAEVGILICDPAHRRCGYGAEALKLTIDYSRRFLGLRILFCSVAEENPGSLALFAAAGFSRA